MAVSADEIERAKELFAPLGSIRVRRMFGGAGVYCNDLFFAILAGGDTYLKVDDESRASFVDRGLSRFSYDAKGETMSMSYYAAPAEIFDDEDELAHWGGLALEAAARAKR